MHPEPVKGMPPRAEACSWLLYTLSPTTCHPEAEHRVAVQRRNTARVREPKDLLCCSSGPTRALIAVAEALLPATTQAYRPQGFRVVEFNHV
jgi:hypothetical protein